MDEHIIDPEKAEMLEDDGRYRIVSREELLRVIDTDDTVVDVGSGTGFFTDDIATHARKVFAVDFQPEMHEYYEEKGVPENVQTIHSKASEVDVADVDVIVSILSFHEIDVPESLEQFDEIGGESTRVLVIDWSANAETDEIPPREKLSTATEAADALAEHFDIVEAEERYDTFRVLATRE